MWPTHPREKASEPLFCFSALRTQRFTEPDQLSREVWQRVFHFLQKDEICSREAGVMDPWNPGPRGGAVEGAGVGSSSADSAPYRV